MLSVANKIPLAQAGRRKWIEAPGVSLAADQPGLVQGDLEVNDLLAIHYVLPRVDPFSQTECLNRYTLALAVSFTLPSATSTLYSTFSQPYCLRICSVFF